jgi:aldose 1-epimerase
MSEVLKLGSGPLQIEVWTLGARLNQGLYGGIALLDAAHDREEALGPKRFNGAVVGPIANRIAGGRVEIAGKTYDLPKNENGETTLHGGAEGLHARDWAVAELSDDAAALVLDLADGVCGLPGNRRFTALYTVGKHDFTVTLEAVSDAETLVNLALHPYWTLDAGGRSGLDLCVKADGYTPVDARKIPTGEVASVDGTMFDLRAPAEPSTGIDHNFVLTGAQPAVTLETRRLKLEIETDAPGLQIYSGKATGIAIEPQHFPDAPHHPGFPSILLRPGETYRQVSTYRLSWR